MPDIWELAVVASKFTLYLGVLTSTGTVFVALLFQVANTRRFTVTFATLALLATVIGFALGGAALAGDVSGMTDPEMLGLLWSTPVGTASLYRLVGLALLIAGCMLGRAGLWLSAFGGGLALWSFASVGHIPDKEMFWLDGLLLTHLAAIAVWIGILTPLQQLADVSTAKEAANLGGRFGRIATVFIPLLILAGLVMSYVLVGSVVSLVGTGYGQALIVKVVVVAVLLGLAALNKLRFVPKLMNADVQAAQHLSQSISFEWFAVVIILLITAVLTSVLTLPS